MNHLNFQKIKTALGVPLYVMNLPHASSVACGVLIKAGTRDETWPKEAGIAHALEHMFFRGTQSFPNGEIQSAYIEEIGGVKNAWTSLEMTFYFNQVPISYKERSVYALAEQLLHPLFPISTIQTEMKNIVQELRRRNDNPQRFALRLQYEFLYGKHPLSKDVLGTEASVLSFTQEDFLAFKNRLYHPGNYTFICAGAISLKEAQTLFEKYFTEPVSAPALSRKRQSLTTPEKKEYTYTKEGIQQIQIVLSAPIGASTDKETKALDLFSTMISGGTSFPLYQEVREKRGLCYEVWADVDPWSDVGIFNLYIGTDPKRYEEAITISLDVIKRYAHDSDLLKRAKKLKAGRVALKFENPMDIINLAAHDASFFGTPKGYNDIISEMEEVSINDVSSAVEKYLKPQQIHRVLLTPAS